MRTVRKADHEAFFLEIEAQREFYWVWYEYLIRTPLFKEMEQRQLAEYEGRKEVPPISPKAEKFLLGYSFWWGNNWLFDWTFEQCWIRLKRTFRQWEKSRAFAFSPHEEIAWCAAQELEIERNERGRLNYQGEKDTIERVAKIVLENRAAREKQSREENIEYRYKRKAPGRNIKSGPSSDTLHALKRRLTYYHLRIVEGWSPSEIMSGEFLGNPPFGQGPFDSDHAEVVIWKNNKDFRMNYRVGQCMGKKTADNFGTKDFLKEEIKQAKRTIAAVESGWFPDFPKLSKFK